MTRLTMRHTIIRQPKDQERGWTGYGTSQGSREGLNGIQDKGRMNSISRRETHDASSHTLAFDFQRARRLYRGQTIRLGAECEVAVVYSHSASTYIQSTAPVSNLATQAGQHNLLVQVLLRRNRRLPSVPSRHGRWARGKTGGCSVTDRDHD